jgi:cell division initiation protein
MPITPIDLRKIRFRNKLRGYDPREVEEVLGLAADELAARLGDVERLESELRGHRERLRQAEERQRELQEALLRAQKVAEEIVANARREAELLVKEAELTGDRVVAQALEQATRIESRIGELRTARRELQLRLKHTLEVFERMLESEIEEERSTATLHTLPRGRRP